MAYVFGILFGVEVFTQGGVTMYSLLCAIMSMWGQLLHEIKKNKDDNN